MRALQESLLKPADTVLSPSKLRGHSKVFMKDMKDICPGSFWEVIPACQPPQIQSLIKYERNMIRYEKTSMKD